MLSIYPENLLLSVKKKKIHLPRVFSLSGLNHASAKEKKETH